jgi:hypothetical protein
MTVELSGCVILSDTAGTCYVDKLDSVVFVLGGEQRVDVSVELFDEPASPLEML